MKKIFIIAGEASGDALGAGLIEQLKLIRDDIIFEGIGGEKMCQLGLNSLFPMKELSIMGFLEIIPSIPKILKRIQQTRLAIKKFNPDIIITIDSPGFCFRVIKNLNIPAKLIHYVAPTVWAYKACRAEKIAKIYDILLVILPFEPPFFLKHNLKCFFIGHNAVYKKKSNATSFKNKYNISKNDKLLCVSFGSRVGEVKRHLEIFMTVALKMLKEFPEIKLIIPSFEHLKDMIIEKIPKEFFNRTIIVTTIDERKLAIESSFFALTKSGTITLELAIAGVPMIVAHKVNYFSGKIMKMIYKKKHVTLVNIVAGDKSIIPEYLLENCTVKQLYPAVRELYVNDKMRIEQLKKSEEALNELRSKNNLLPDLNAANLISEVLDN